MPAGVVTIDLHGRNQTQARVTIDSQLRRAKGDVYRIRIIHGFNSGTALREMIEQEYKNHPKVRRLLRLDAGTTDLVLREF